MYIKSFMIVQTFSFCSMLFLYSHLNCGVRYGVLAFCYLVYHGADHLDAHSLDILVALDYL